MIKFLRNCFLHKFGEKFWKFVIFFKQFCHFDHRLWVTHLEFLIEKKNQKNIGFEGDRTLFYFKGFCGEKLAAKGVLKELKCRGP